jgi:hypothetical protein
VPETYNLDLVWTLAALVPLAVAAAAWALRMACGFCSIEPPEFWHAVTIVVIIAITNVVLRFFLQVTDSAYGMGPEYLAPALATAAVIALSVPTGPFVALTVTVVQVILCAMIYYSVLWIQSLLVVPIFR